MGDQAWGPRIKNWLAWAGIWTVVLLVLATCGFGVYSSDKADEEYWNGPCSNFADRSVDHIPARCLNYFKDRP